MADAGFFAADRGRINEQGGGRMASKPNSAKSDEAEPKEAKAGPRDGQEHFGGKGGGKKSHRGHSRKSSRK